MRITRDLRLVLTVDQDKGPVHVYSTPISDETFDQYFLTISKTYTAIIEQGGEYVLRMGPRVAKRMLKRVAEADGVWADVEKGLLNEIRRRTNVISSGEIIPFQEVIDRKLFTDEDVSEVENAVCFFTVCCAALKKSEADSMVSAVFSLYGAQITSLSVTEFQASLPTSSETESSGAKVPPSSIPI